MRTSRRAARASVACAQTHGVERALEVFGGGIARVDAQQQPPPVVEPGRRGHQEIGALEAGELRGGLVADGEGLVAHHDVTGAIVEAVGLAEEDRRPSGEDTGSVRRDRILDRRDVDALEHEGRRDGEADRIQNAMWTARADLDGAEAGLDEAPDVVVVGDGSRETHGAETIVRGERRGQRDGRHRIAQHESSLWTQDAMHLGERATELRVAKDVEEAVLCRDADARIVDREGERVAVADVDELLADHAFTRAAAARFIRAAVRISATGSMPMTAPDRRQKYANCRSSRAPPIPTCKMVGWSTRSRGWTVVPQP
jgi:hypothetical protein